AGNAKRSQPRETVGKIAEAFTEENARRDQIRRVGTGSLSARVADPPGQPGRHQRLVQVVPVHLALDRKIGCIKPRTPRVAPVAVNPSAIDTDSERWSEQTKKRPAKPLIDDIAPFIWMLRAREERQYRLVGNGGIIK